MRVALVILHADRKRGGAEGYTLQLAEALAKRGHDVSLLASSFGELMPASVARVTIETRGLTRAARYRRFLDALDAHLSTTTYDVVHAMLPVRQCDVYHPHAGLAIAKAGQTGARLAFNARRRLMAETERSIVESDRPPIVISLSEYVKTDVAGQYPTLPADRQATLFNAVGLDYFDPAQAIPRTRDEFRNGRKISANDRVALVVAQDFERKGVPQAIEATKRINAGLLPGESRLKLLVVGGERSPGVEGDVIFAGTSWKVVVFYAGSDFFVLPTRHDPCSLVVLEALAMGLPVVSTVFNGATEIMRDGEHGFVLKDPNDVDALTAAMRTLMDDDTRARMSSACLALRPKLSYDAHLDKLLSVYETARSTRVAR
jgi:UDP-glucose:(heptosyl)LPS alpha-1,3-glucosyltransferase